MVGNQKKKRGMIMAHVKTYDPGQFSLDLPTSNYLYELPLFSINDFYGGFSLTLVYNYDAGENNNNHFDMRTGYKLNLQKRLLFSDNHPYKYVDASYKIKSLIENPNFVFTFDDDSQRILRENVNGGYEVEYPDGSKEIFDPGGYITNAVDKYNSTVFAYAYDSEHKITAITYRSDKTITFTYNSLNQIESTTYASNSTTFSYSSSGINVEAFSGECIRLQANGYNLLSTVGHNNASNTFVPNNAIYISGELDGEYVTRATVTKRIYDLNGAHTEPWYTIYDFPNLNSSGHSYNQVEITDYYGVKKRIQYHNKKPQYSYEVIGDDVLFSNVNNLLTYTANVEVLQTNNSTSDTRISGIQTLHNGTKLQPYPGDARVWYISGEDIPESNSDYYILSGWAKSTVDSTGNTQPKIIANSDMQIEGKTHKTEIVVDLTPYGQWKYFSVMFKHPGGKLELIPEPLNSLMLADVRITASDFSSDEEFSRMTMLTDGLVPRSKNLDEFMPIGECMFFFDGNETQIDKAIHYEDIFKYKVNYKNTVHTDEFYGEKVSCVIHNNNNDELRIRVVCGITTYFLDECYLVKRRYLGNGKIQYTWLIDDDPRCFLATEITDENKERISFQTIDSHFDVVSTEKDNVLNSVARNEVGLVTGEFIQTSAPNNNYVYRNIYSYGIDANGNSCITSTDFYNNVTVQRFDSVWGAPISVTYPDGSVMTDEFDDSKRALLKRSLGGASGRYNTLSYSDGYVSGMDSAGLNYTFGYTDGVLSCVEKCGSTIEEYEHTDDSDSSYFPSKSIKSYGITTNFDKYRRVTSVDGIIENEYDLVPRFNASTGNLEPYINDGTDQYNSAAKLASTTDILANEKERFTYDNRTQQLRTRTVTSSSDYSVKKYDESFEYDSVNRLSRHTTKYDFGTQATNYKSVSGIVTYKKAANSPNADNVVYKYEYEINGNPIAKTFRDYDIYGRNWGKSVMLGNQSSLYMSINYDKTRISSVDYELETDETITLRNEYTYDSMGRIETESFSPYNLATKYYYDSYGQLVREDNPFYNNTFTYEYDNCGNITSAKRYNYTQFDLPASYTSFAYGYSSTVKDRLISYGGEAISYDKYGQISSYKGLSFSWSNGRLSLMRKGTPKLKDGDYVYHEYSYNAKGQRTQKTYIYDSKTEIFGSPHPTYKTYYWYDHFGRLIHEYCVETFKGETYSNTHDLTYIYDDTGMVGVNYSYNGGATQSYFYLRNLRGDVIAIYDVDGVKQAEYAYDAYGNTKLVSYVNEPLARYNPIRYRGYYYDRETGLYYLNSRYYNPEWRRFISPDSAAYLDPENINGLNLYAYCNNDPINYCDPSGQAPEWWQWLISGVEVALGIVLCFVPGMQGWGVTFIGTGAGAIINGYITESNGGSFAAGWWGGQVGGFASAIPGIGIPVGAFLGSITTDAIDNGWNGIDWGKAIFSSLVAWGIGSFSGIVGELLSKFKIYDKAIYFINAYNTVFTSTANSIVNVFWRGRTFEK